MPKHCRRAKPETSSESSSESSSDSDKSEKTRSCQHGRNGKNGQNGKNGLCGPIGPIGPIGSLLGGADFYALMPGDNSATVAVGTAVQFPSDGPTMNTNIVRAGPSTFTLKAIGYYMVNFQVSVSEPGQLGIALGGVVVPYTITGRATGTSQITGMCLIQTTLANQVLSIINPLGNSTALTITPLAGGTNSVSAHVVILQLA